MLARHGIGEKDFNTIETAFGNMPAMLLSKKVDMIVVLPQFQRLLDKDREKVKSLFSMRDAVGAQQTIMWVARADSMAKNRAAWVDYFEDYLRGLRWVLDPKNHAEAIKAVVAFTKQSPESVDYAFTENDYYRDPNGEPSLQGIKNGLQEALESGVLKQPLENVESHMDLSPLREARKRIDGDKASSLR